MQAIDEHDDLELKVIAMASAILDRYGAVVEHIKSDGFSIDASLNILVEGETPMTMAKSAGLGLIEMPTVINQMSPDIVVTVGDRFETVSTALTAAMMNIPLAHTMGGEVSGTIDESLRHAITKLSHIHFPACEDAANRIISMGEDKGYVFNHGCPRIDLVKNILDNNESVTEEELKGGVGDSIDLSKPFLLVSQHPVTTEYGHGQEQILETLKACHELDIQTIVLWPNADAGSSDIARGIRKWREQGLAKKMHFIKNLPIDIYVKLMKKTSCLIGNSSSGIREGAYIGTPVVNIGTRQTARQRGRNVIDVDNTCSDIICGIKSQLERGPYDAEPIYGDGKAGVAIANTLSTVNVDVQKRITY